MINQEQHNVIKNALDHYGTDAQIDKTIEECTELTLALIRFKESKNIKTESCVIDELADVEIMLESMRNVFNLFSIQDRVDFKIERLNDRIEA